MPYLVLPFHKNNQDLESILNYQSSQGYRFIQAVRESTYKWVLVFEKQ
jgi:hypothetical protein